MDCRLGHLCQWGQILMNPQRSQNMPYFQDKLIINCYITNRQIGKGHLALNTTISTKSIILDYIKSNKKATSFFVVFGLFWAFTLPLMSYLLGRIVDQVKDSAVMSGSVFGLIAFPVCAFILINNARNIGYLIHGYTWLNTVPFTKRKIVLDMLHHLGMQSSKYYEDKYSGDLVNKVNNAANSIDPVFMPLMTTLLPQFLAIVFSGLMLATVSPIFSILFWCWATALVMYSYHSARVGKEKSKNFASVSSKTYGLMTDILTNIQCVIVNATLHRELNTLSGALDGLTEKDQSMQRYLTKLRFIQLLFTNFLILANMIVLIYGYDNNWVSVGEFVFVLDLVFAISVVTREVGANLLELMKALGRLQEGLAIFDDAEEIKEIINAKPLVVSEGAIEFNNLTFSYSHSDTILKNFNFKITGGEKIGVVGRTGCGKSTLLKLLLRLYDPKQGEIRIDCQPITAVTKQSLREQLALVPQQSHLFHRSIKDNIVYGCSNPKDYKRAAVLAHCDEFINKLPEGYDTLVGERGVKLSGGQCQRISIARAILKNGPILLLDEATSALDSDTENYIQESLAHLMKDKTAIVVAHRLSTLKLMDRIIVIDNGSIAEDGTHEALLAKKGIYYNFWLHQADGYIVDY